MIWAPPDKQTRPTRKPAPRKITPRKTAKKSRKS